MTEYVVTGWIQGILGSAALVFAIRPTITAYAATHQFGLWHAIVLTIVLVAISVLLQLTVVSTAWSIGVGGALGVALAMRDLRRRFQRRGTS